MQPELTPLGEGRLPVMVVSHERSGTHFLMNTLDSCFGYVGRPWINFDREQFNINYYHPETLRTVLLKLGALRAANVIKSHHEFAFFSEVSKSLEGALQILYIYRNPADVMTSFWRFLNTWYWAEGPKVDSAIDLATAAPMGQLMRYQFSQHDTMLDRWANHVSHWNEAAARSNHIHAVKYEDLTERFEETVGDLGDALSLEPRRIERPSRHQNTIKAGDRPYEPPANIDSRPAVVDLAKSKYPNLMPELGYT